MVATRQLAGWAALTMVAAATPSWALDGSVSAELTAGRLFSVGLLGDLGVVPDQLYLVGGYGFVRPANASTLESAPVVAPVPTHLFSLGVDAAAGRHLLFSSMVTFSPWAKDAVLIDPAAPAALQLTMSTSRRSLSAFLGALYSSGGWSDLEGSADVGLSAAASGLGRTIELGSDLLLGKTEPLYTLRPTVGGVFTLFGRHDLGLRGAWTWYSGDPLKVGRFSPQELLKVQNAFSAASARFATTLESVQNASSSALARVGQADALSGYTLAPVWFELRGSYLWRFRPTMSLQFSYTFMRYVPTQGRAHLLGARYSWRMARPWRAWVSTSLQYDQPLDDPSQRTETSPQPGFTGLLSVGAEFAP